ncbi:hypothetical protein DPEC_G00251710 [Dallia pectoralis]|uniref:Uncharacterized protein n=1 Tax=Dallia pectoralis TaxID=75939 RepID=A0ACC2FTK7_DALPE|nr:hypothetical protein DPEC_G00251710 [Dallia pectoralis]
MPRAVNVKTFCNNHSVDTKCCSKVGVWASSENVSALRQPPLPALPGAIAGLGTLVIATPPRPEPAYESMSISLRQQRSTVPRLAMEIGPLIFRFAKERVLAGWKNLDG